MDSFAPYHRRLPTCVGMQKTYYRRRVHVVARASGLSKCVADVMRHGSRFQRSDLAQHALNFQVF